VPVRRAGPRRVDTPPPSFAEEMRLGCDAETPLDPEKWERWTCDRSAPRPWPYRDGAVNSLRERGIACEALGFDPDPDIARLAAARLAADADRHADWFLHGAVGWGTGIPRDPAALAVWRVERAAPYRAAAEFWRARVAELSTTGED
jgi:hypothetical protein